MMQNLTGSGVDVITGIKLLSCARTSSVMWLFAAYTEVMTRQMNKQTLIAMVRADKVPEVCSDRALLR